MVTRSLSPNSPPRFPKYDLKVQDILPEAVLIALRQHYYAGVMAAEIGYEFNAADEDSVTGALGKPY